MLTGGTAAKILVDQKDFGAAKFGIVEWMYLPSPPNLRSVILESMGTQTVKYDCSQIASRNDTVRVNVVSAQNNAGPDHFDSSCVLHGVCTPLREIPF
jgi:hypothetical protein